MVRVLKEFVLSIKKWTEEWVTSANSFWLRMHFVIFSVMWEEKSTPQIIRTHCVFPTYYDGIKVYTCNKSDKWIEQSVIQSNPKWVKPRPNPIERCDDILTSWIALGNVHFKASKWMNSISAENMPNWRNYPVTNDDFAIARISPFPHLSLKISFVYRATNCMSQDSVCL